MYGRNASSRFPLVAAGPRPYPPTDNAMSQSPPPIPQTISTPHFQAAPRRSPWGWIFGILFIGGGLLTIGCIGYVCTTIAAAIKESGGLAHAQIGSSHETTLVEGGGDKIAHIDLEGVISASANRPGESMVDDFADQLETALEDHQVKAIVIRIHSPGGEVTASDKLHHMIQQADQRKPVIAYLDTIAASGGYYAACGTRHLMAHPTTFTGSIGVIMHSMKYAALFDKIGLGMEVYKSGKMKDLLSGTRETSSEEIALVNGLIAETYDRFLSVVAENRRRDVQELRNSPFTDGRIFSGKQGLDAGFIDSNGFIADAYQKAAELAGIRNPTVICYENRPSLFELLDPLASSRAAHSKLEIDVSERLLPHLQPGVPLYLHAD